MHFCKLINYVAVVNVVGMQKAVDIFRMDSRLGEGALGVVVFITEGRWNTEGNPIGVINTLKNYMKVNRTDFLLRLKPST